MDTILATSAFTVLVGAWIAIGKRRSRTPKVTILESSVVEQPAA